MPIFAPTSMFAMQKQNTYENGTVVKSTGSAYIVRADNGTMVECRLKGKMRLSGSRSTNPVAVGDHVAFFIDPKAGGVIADVSDRTNYIVRRATNLSKQTHVIAANLDQVLLVVTVNYPETSTTFIDRYLASAEAYSVPVIIDFNKTDRYQTADNDELDYREALYRSIGYTTIRTSAETGEGLEQLKAILKGKVTLLSGHSGVGKSTLINKVEPTLSLRTNEISEQNNSGKHTTTFAEMHPLSFGGHVVDTPGVRGFGIINIEREEVSHYFRDIFSVSPQCRFPNCTHTHEPGCAVVEAVEQGEIAPTRYASYVNILDESEGKYRGA